MLIWFVVIYLMASIGIGLYAATRVHNAKDFAVAGRHLPTPVVPPVIRAGQRHCRRACDPGHRMLGSLVGPRFREDRGPRNVTTPRGRRQDVIHRHREGWCSRV